MRSFSKMLVTFIPLSVTYENENPDPIADGHYYF